MNVSSPDAAFHGLGNTLSSAQTHTDRMYRGVRDVLLAGRGGEHSRQLQDVLSSLRLILGSLHSISLLVDEIGPRRPLDTASETAMTDDGGDGNVTRPFLPERNLFVLLGNVLDQLEGCIAPSYDRHENCGPISLQLQVILGELQCAAGTDSYPRLLLALAATYPPSAGPSPVIGTLASSSRTDDEPMPNEEEPSNIMASLLRDEYNFRPGDVHAYKLFVARRDMMDPDYARAVGLLRSFEKRSEHLSYIGQLFSSPKTHLLEHFVVEYARQQWPDSFDASRAAKKAHLVRLLNVVANPDLKPYHIAAAFWLSDFCASEADPDTVHQDGPLGTTFYCALVGPEAVFARAVDPLQLFISSRPPPEQRITLHSLMGHDSFLRYFHDRERSFTMGPDPDVVVSVTTMGFLVFHSLGDSAGFLKLLAGQVPFDQRFLDLVEGKSSMINYWPLQFPALSPTYLQEVLPMILNKAVASYDSEQEMSRLGKGITQILDHYGLSIVPPFITEQKIALDTESYHELCFKALMSDEIWLLRRLVQESRWDPNRAISRRTPKRPDLPCTHYLHAAVEYNFTDALEILLQSDNGYRQVDVHIRNELGQTPLMLCETPEALMMLLSRGGRTTDRDEVGRNIWHIAAANSDIPLIECLNQVDEHREQNLKAQTRDGQTPIAEAVCFNFDIMCQGEVEQALQGPKTALHMLQACKVARDPVYIENRDRPLLFYAAEWGSVQLATSLIRWGADVNLVDQHGRSALHHMNASMTDRLVRTLQGTVPKLVQDAEGLTPAEHIFAVFNGPSRLTWVGSRAEVRSNHPANHAILAEAVYMKLLTQETLDSRDAAGAGLWQRFASRVLGEWGPAWSEKLEAGPSVMAAVRCLIKAGALAKYEEETGLPGLHPVFATMKFTSWTEELIAVVRAASTSANPFTTPQQSIDCLTAAGEQRRIGLAKALTRLIDKFVLEQPSGAWAKMEISEN
ncbi:Ankyrin repeat and death domain-containing protein 1B [Colletotrichum orbiculare MAFF 240422]|uniref:Ankyrin repeat and death domain-containing protein 1B n=1 Tax=Colletotrichum orbiculare (strain 104-T / ATCC 96160 / CBS 514.97 / LARS 414 / MAFF 240422) TaxID=1213857 RepID=N4V6B3_COLOR|nr:Ankyrin repeat and death domain-containing protein 1B [Colletotrichum orbiculare MAFF 240422]